MVDVTVVAPPDDGSDGIGTYTGDLVGSFSEEVSTNYVSVPAGSTDPRPYLSAAIRAGRSGADVIHVQHEYALFGPNSLYSWPFFVVLSILARIDGVPLVITLHSAWNDETVAGESLAWLKRLYVRANNELIAAVGTHLVFLSENCLDSYFQSVPLEDYSVFRHGVRVGATRDIDRAEAKTDFGYDPDDFVVVEPGYVREQKGIHVFVDVAERFPEVEFLVAGGPQDEAAATYAEELRERAPRNVQFTGHLPDERFHAAFVAADLACLPYLRMTQSGIFNWCVAYGVPVAASDHDYFTRLAAEWDCVDSFDPTDVDNVAETVGTLIESSERRATLAKGLAAFREANSFSSVAAEHLSLYRRLVA